VRVLGLTGGIGMGKSTVLRALRRSGLAVWDADRAVHRLYARGGAAVAAVAALVPEAVRDGAVDRAALGAAVLADRSLLARLEALVHPLVRRAEARFIAAARRARARAAVLDIPLLYETGGERRVDAVIVVSAPRAVQLRRVLARPGMTQERLAAILARQMPDREKRRRADLVVPTGLSRGFALARLRRGLPRLMAR
jgi:dephospho-CoA kinase